VALKRRAHRAEITTDLPMGLRQLGRDVSRGDKPTTTGPMPSLALRLGDTRVIATVRLPANAAHRNAPTAGRTLASIKERRAVRLGHRVEPVGVVEASIALVLGIVAFLLHVGPLSRPRRSPPATAGASAHSTGRHARSVQPRRRVPAVPTAARESRPRSTTIDRCPAFAMEPSVQPRRAAVVTNRSRMECSRAARCRARRPSALSVSREAVR